MSLTVTIRPLTPADATGLTALFHRCSQRTRVLFSPVNNFYTDRGVHWLLEELEASRYVAESDGELVGLAYLREAANVAYFGILVADPWQRHGIGTSFLQHLEAEARRWGCIGLATAGGTHVHGALRPLLQRLGFIDLAPYGTTDQILMAKPLTL